MLVNMIRCFLSPWWSTPVSFFVDTDFLLYYTILTFFSSWMLVRITLSFLDSDINSRYNFPGKVWQFHWDSTHQIWSTSDVQVATVQIVANCALLHTCAKTCEICLNEWKKFKSVVNNKIIVQRFELFVLKKIILIQELSQSEWEKQFSEMFCFCFTYFDL